MSNQKSLADFINPEDYVNVTHYFLIRNESSRTFISEYQKIKLLQVNQLGLTLQVPENSCQKNHNLTIFIFNQRPKGIKIPHDKKIKGAVECLGKITEFNQNQIEEVEIEGSKRFKKHYECIITIEFSQVDEKPWSEIVNKYKSIEEKARLMNPIDPQEEGPGQLDPQWSEDNQLKNDKLKE